MSRERKSPVLLPTMSSLSHLKEALKLAREAKAVAGDLAQGIRLSKVEAHIEKAIEIETR